MSEIRISRQLTRSEVSSSPRNQQNAAGDLLKRLGIENEFFRMFLVTADPCAGEDLRSAYLSGIGQREDRRRDIPSKPRDRHTRFAAI
jgi:hypothetical protein